MTMLRSARRMVLRLTAILTTLWQGRVHHLGGADLAAAELAAAEPRQGDGRAMESRSTNLLDKHSRLHRNRPIIFCRRIWMSMTRLRFTDNYQHWVSMTARCTAILTTLWRRRIVVVRRRTRMLLQSEGEFNSKPATQEIIFLAPIPRTVIW